MRKTIQLLPVLIGLALAPLSSGESKTGASIARPGKDYALFFAVNQYEHLDDLRNPIANAQELARELNQSFGFQTEVVKNPTIDQIDGKIEEYRRRFSNGTYAADGQLFIYFSGHGVQAGANGYFMAADSDPARPQRSAMEYDYYQDKIDQINCRHILVAIDACHSATFDPSYGSRNDGRRFQRKGEEEFDRILANHESYRARCFWTSDGVGEQTPDRSNFAYQLLEGLRSHRHRSGYLRSSELFSVYLEKAAPKPGGGRFGRDEPNACFLFFANSEGPDPAEEEFWNWTKEDNTREAYVIYLKRYPDGHYKEQADEALKSFPQPWITPDGEVWGADGDKPAIPPDQMAFLQGGSFEMGDDFGDGSDDEKLVHTVTVGDFYLGRHEVTFEEFDAFCEATGREKPGDEGWGRDRRPVINVSWLDAVEYCNWRSRREGLPEVYRINGSNVSADWNAAGYRLPTEAEWEFAARSRGKKEKWAGTSDEGSLASYANFCDKNCELSWKTKGQKDGYANTAPVGSLRPNAAGLYDMSGNVYEWCWDWYGSDYYKQSKNSRDPKGPETGSSRVVRGGSWNGEPADVRVALRFSLTPGNGNGLIGFRLARAVR